ncbi:MAG: FHA domain-containing protein [Hyphomicrobium sp.]
MQHERGEASEGHGAKGAKANGFFGSLKDALLAAGREDTAPVQPAAAPGPQPIATPAAKVALPAETPAPAPGLSAEEAARLARAGAATKPLAKIPAEPAPLADAPPTTRVLRREPAPPAVVAPVEAAPRTQLVRGKQAIERAAFDRDPVVGFLIVVGGPGLGAHRSIYEGNNTVGRAGANRIPLDFGDETISADAQAYIRYDSSDRSFLFVPNLAKTNVAAVNDKRPTAAVELKAMDVITLGRTQVAFVPFCGPEFDWSEISET